jgi:hypothetical protein
MTRCGRAVQERFISDFGHGRLGNHKLIPDNGTNGDAILSHYVADGSSSWVNLRFGKCRVK